MMHQLILSYKVFTFWGAGASHFKLKPNLRQQSHVLHPSLSCLCPLHITHTQFLICYFLLYILSSIFDLSPVNHFPFFLIKPHSIDFYSFFSFPSSADSGFYCCVCLPHSAASCLTYLNHCTVVFTLS